MMNFGRRFERIEDFERNEVNETKRGTIRCFENIEDCKISDNVLHDIEELLGKTGKTEIVKIDGETYIRIGGD